MVKVDVHPGGGRMNDLRHRWRSPIRGPWLTSVFGLVLLVGIPVEFVTGLLSYAAYNPRLGNDPNPAHGLFGFYLFDWFTEPAWLYRLIQGVHVILGLALVPIILRRNYGRLCPGCSSGLRSGRWLGCSSGSPS